jgi:hypothetical protein
MTEAEWSTHSHPDRMLESLPVTPSQRRLRLFGCAVCCRVPEVMAEVRCRKVVESSEQFADELIPESELNSCLVAVMEASHDARMHADHEAMFRANCVAYVSMSPLPMHRVISAIRGAFLPQSAKGARRERAAQANLLRDIFGNPFRPVTFSPSWRTDTALSLARQMYDARDFSTMPILADALQDAGCDSEDILGHCRDASATHVRGCWVVDLVLGKE